MTATTMTGDELETARAIPALELDAERLLRQDGRLRVGLGRFVELVNVARAHRHGPALRRAARAVFASALLDEVPDGDVFVDGRASLILALALEIAEDPIR